VNRQAHHQQELQRYSHGRQFIADSFIAQLQLTEILEVARRSKTKILLF
jgi:hypothetical protein